MYKRSFFQQIFLAILFILGMASIAFVVITYFQSNRTAEKYNEVRLTRSEERIKNSITYAIGYDQDHSLATTKNVVEIISPRLYELVETEDVNTRIYDLNGYLLFDTNQIIDTTKGEQNRIKDVVMKKIRSMKEGESTVFETNKDTYSSFFYIKNQKEDKIGIIELPYVHESKFLKEERNNLLINTAVAVSVLFLIALVFAYFLSKRITNRIEKISATIRKTDINTSLQPVDYDNDDELSSIVDSYNKMVGKLKESTESLAKYEREEAWKNMARQVAHEIKNPLTPMRLSIQSFQMRFNPCQEDAQQKVDTLCDSLIQQIDTLSSITSAFADFAKMPVRKDEVINMVEVVKKSLDIFDSRSIAFNYSEENIPLYMDKSELSRVVNNLVKNAIQAIPKGRIPDIQVNLFKETSEIILIIKDNGIGIEEELQDKIFEPQFTTKTAGMGLGLAMVRKIIDDYNGTVELISDKGKGSTFMIKFPC